MKIWHRGHIGPEHKSFLDENAIKCEPWFGVRDPHQILSYMAEIDEGHPAFLEFKVRLRGKHTYIATKFAPEEVAQAEWSIAWASHSIGSFVPEGQWWCKSYYADQCNHCGMGWRQVVPFRIKREPRLGKNMFADFGSAFELFCTPMVLEVFKGQGFSGFESQPIILDKENCPSESLKQFIVSEIADPAVAEDHVEHERYSQTDCPVCGRTWHAHYTRGALPLRRAALNSSVDFQLTNEWFGNGRTARREILFSRRAVNLVLDKGWKGIQFIPVNVV